MVATVNVSLKNLHDRELRRNSFGQSHGVDKPSQNYSYHSFHFLVHVLICLGYQLSVSSLDERRIFSFPGTAVSMPSKEVQYRRSLRESSNEYFTSSKHQSSGLNFFFRPARKPAWLASESFILVSVLVVLHDYSYLCVPNKYSAG